MGATLGATDVIELAELGLLGVSLGEAIRYMILGYFVAGRLSCCMI